MNNQYYRNLTRGIVRMQGWNESSIITHLEGFLESKGLVKEFSEYAQKLADDENESIIDGDITFDFI